MKIVIETDDLKEVGDNLQAGIQDNHLIIVAELSKEIGKSSSGKMMGVASTGGFSTLPGNLKGNIYIGRKA